MDTSIFLISLLLCCRLVVRLLFSKISKSIQQTNEKKVEAIVSESAKIRKMFPPCSSSSSSAAATSLSIWRTALSSAHFRLSQPATPLGPWFRQSFLDIKRSSSPSSSSSSPSSSSSSWSMALRLFETALLSGGCVDRDTFRDACTATCQCGECAARRRCSGVALLCASETNSTLSRLGSVCPVLRRRKNNSEITSSAASDDFSLTELSSPHSNMTTWPRIIEQWRQVETQCVSSSTSSSQSSSLSSMDSATSVVDLLHLIQKTSRFVSKQEVKERQQQQQQQLHVDEISAYAPHASRFALWSNAWQLGSDAHVHIPLHQLQLKQHVSDNISTRNSGSWIPEATLHIESSVQQLSDRARNMMKITPKKQSSNSNSSGYHLSSAAPAPRLIIPTASLLRHSRGLTCVAEASRNAVVVISPSVFAEAVLLARKNDSAASALPAHLRTLLKVFFPQNCASPPKRVLALPVVDELRFLDTAAMLRYGGSDDDDASVPVSEQASSEDDAAMSLAVAIRLLTAPKLMRRAELELQNRRREKKEKQEQLLATSSSAATTEKTRNPMSNSNKKDAFYGMFSETLTIFDDESNDDACADDAASGGASIQSVSVLTASSSSASSSSHSSWLTKLSEVDIESI